MALLTTAAYVNLGSILAIGGKSLTDTHSSPQVGLGTLSIQVDGFGYHRIFRYVRFMAAFTAGLVLQRAAVVTGTTDGAGTTTLVIDAGGFTAGNETGKIFQVNVASAAAPEGETAIIGSNTSGALSLDTRYPLSVAAASGITYSDFGVAHYIAGTTSSPNIQSSGVVMGAPAALDYGWCQIQGYHPAVSVDAASAAITASAAAAHGATSQVILLATAASQQALYIGWFPQATSTTAVQAGMVIDVFGQAQPIA